MPQRKIYNRFKIAGHLVFWFATIVFLSLIFYVNDERIHLNLIYKSVVTNIGFALAVYTNLYVLIPKFLKQKNYIFYIFWVVILLTVSSVIRLFSFCSDALSRFAERNFPGW